MRAVLRSQGTAGLLRAIARRIAMPRAPSYRVIAPLVREKVALEIGGPSTIFARAGLIPLYPLLARVDNCNFSRNTVWEGGITEGTSFKFDVARGSGQQFIAEACALSQASSASYDVVLSSHSLEHTANPLLALREWQRVLVRGGLLVLVLPHGEGTFDHRRPVTRLEHLQHDLARETGENDLSHLPEVLALHDLARDPAAGSRESFLARSARNLENRCLHHHVFDTRLVVGMLDAAGFTLRSVETVRPYHILTVAEKASGATVENAAFLADDAPWVSRSVFASDRRRPRSV